MIPQWTSIRTFLVQQEYEQVQESAITLVKNSDPDHQALLKQIKAIEDDEEVTASAQKLADLYEELHSVFEDSEMERRAINILTDLKFGKGLMNKPFRELSRGWRMKALLACAIFANSDLLLMDEPTNHLDLESIQWLVQYVRKLECTVIIVSHDQDFLDQVAEYKLNEQSNTEKKKKQARITGSTKKLEALSAPKIAKMSKKNLVDESWKYGFESLLVGHEAEDDKNLVLKFPDPDRSVSDPLVQIKDVGFAYGDKVLWDNVDLSIDGNSRIAILGKNRQGKSTLMSMIAGNIAPLRGRITRHHNLRMAYFTQHMVQDIDLTKTPVELVLEMFPDQLNTQTARDYLGSFGISGDRALTKLGVLSGGQRTRFVFAIIMFEHPHLLLLDEPTSHLDMEMTDALISALNEFKGAIVVISHHVYFLRSLNCRFYLLKNRKLLPILLDDYLLDLISST